MHLSSEHSKCLQYSAYNWEIKKQWKRLRKFLRQRGALFTALGEPSYRSYGKPSQITSEKVAQRQLPGESTGFLLPALHLGALGMGI